MKPARLLAASILFLVLLTPALFAATSTGASSLSPALADAPRGLVSVAFQAGHFTGIDGNVLLAIAKVECDYGRCGTGQPDDLVPDDIRAHVDAAALRPGGATAALLGLPERTARRGLGEPAGGGRRARHGPDAVPPLHLARRGGRRARPAPGPLSPARRHDDGRVLPAPAGDSRRSASRPARGAGGIRRQPGLRGPDPRPWPSRRSWARARCQSCCRSRRPAGCSASRRRPGLRTSPRT
jgi:hypothetical protein